ncbi:MAG: hypothetical protein RI957_523 [Verrucomicrobiota bacterium]|jgi:hypothetical protein
MKLVSRFALTLMCCTAAFAVQRAADYPEAQRLAKEHAADIVVLVIGSDWNPSSRRYASTWNDGAFADTLPPETILFCWDKIENPDEAAKILGVKNKDCPAAVRSIPGLALIDKDGRLVGTRNGVQELGEPSQLIKHVKNLLTTRVQRDASWKRAEQLQGVNRAEAFGQGLDVMKQQLGHRKAYEPILQEMKKADPEDKSGYIGKYQFPGADLAPHVLSAYVQKKLFAEGENYLLQWHQNPRLDAEQRQHLHAARFCLYQHWPEKQSMVRKALEDLRDVNPQSLMGQSATRYLGHLYPPLTYDGGWKPSHLKGERSSWKIDVTKQIPQKGDYTLSFRYRSGGDALVIHSTKLIDRQGVLGSDDHAGSTGHQNKNNSYRFSLTRKPVGQVWLHTEVSAGTRNDSAGTFLIDPFVPGSP